MMFDVSRNINTTTWNAEKLMVCATTIAGLVPSRFFDSGRASVAGFATWFIHWDSRISIGLRPSCPKATGVTGLDFGGTMEKLPWLVVGMTM